MSDIIREYAIKIIREEGEDPLTGELYPKLVEEFNVEATSEESAHTLAMLLFKMKVRGQLLRFFIDGQEYFDPRY